MQQRLRLKTSTIIISLAVMLALLIVCSNLFVVANAVEYKVDSTMDKVMAEIEEKTREDVSYSASSNPYHYTDGSYFSELVALGPKALPSIEKAIANSTENGLREYLFAIAAEEIAQTNIRNYDCEWSNAKGFLDAWGNYLEKVDSLVDEIIARESENQLSELKSLGLPAVPKIAEEINNGKAQLIPALESIAADVGIDADTIITEGESGNLVNEIREYLQ